MTGSTITFHNEMFHTYRPAYGSSEFLALRRAIDEEVLSLASAEHSMLALMGYVTSDAVSRAIVLESVERLTITMPEDNEALSGVYTIRAYSMLMSGRRAEDIHDDVFVARMLSEFNDVARLMMVDMEKCGEFTPAVMIQRVRLDVDNAWTKCGLEDFGEMAKKFKG